MILRDIKNKINNKKFKIIIMLSITIYLLLFLSLKNEFFYSTSQYANEYLKYYIETYLAGNANDLIFENDVMLYIESGVMNIYSALYLYVVTFNNNAYILFSIFISLFIFHNISSKFYCEMFNGNSILQVFRIGQKKYLNKTIISNCINSGLLFLIPKLFYFLILNVFFTNGISYVHFLRTATFISDKFLYVGYNCSPILLICLDFIISFLYGVIISYISLIIISLIKNKSLSYLVFIFTIATFSIIPLFFNQIPLIYYSSIYNYFNMLNITSLEVNVYEPIINAGCFSLISLIITRIILKFRIRKCV